LSPLDELEMVRASTTSKPHLFLFDERTRGSRQAQQRQGLAAGGLLHAE
jgi:hypothetical protein